MRKKTVIYAVLVLLFVFIWAELGVGLIGTPWAGS